MSTSQIATRTLRPPTGVPVDPSGSTPQDRAIEMDTARRIGFLATIALLFVKASTIHEIVYFLTGVPLFVLYVFTPPAVGGMVLSGGIDRTMRHRAAWWFMAFAIWMVAVVPFSSWIGGSALTVFQYYRDQVPILFLVAGTIFTWKEYRTVLNCLAFSAVVLIPFALFFGGGEGRLTVQGTIGNANDLAAHLLLLIPFLLMVVARSGAKGLFRLASLAFAGLALYAVFRTASRGALIAMAAGLVVYLLRAPVRQRIIAALLFPVLMVGVIVVLPEGTLQRLQSFTAGENAVEEAVESSQSREYVLRKSIEFTLRRPLTGVGPGQFSSFEGSQSKKAGLRGKWNVTHNAYTQVSSESGIPALLFLLCALGSMFFTLGRVARRARQVGHTEIATTANLMMTSFTMLCTAITFLSLSYMYYYPLMIGLAIAMYFTSEKEFRVLASLKQPRKHPAASPAYDQAHAGGRPARLV